MIAVMLVQIKQIITIIIEADLFSNGIFRTYQIKVQSSFPYYTHTYVYGGGSRGGRRWLEEPVTRIGLKGHVTAAAHNGPAARPATLPAEIVRQPPRRCAAAAAAAS